jgi:hypothetical protein
MKRTKKAALVSKKTPRRAGGARRASGIRETEEARALLEDQLHGLYWWIFNAFRIKGFIRAKRLDELDTANVEEAAVSSKDQVL